MSLPSPCFTEVTPRKSPGLMSERAIGLAKTISVLSPTVTCEASPRASVTERTLPSNAAMVPRTRVGAWASAAVAAATRTIAKTLLRRIDAILAHRDALRDELAALVARAGEDRRAGLEVGAAAGRESEELGLARDQDLLLAVLVLERELVAAAHLRGAFDVGVGHHRIGDRVPCAVHLGDLRPELVHAPGHEASIRALDRGHADVAARLEVRRGGLLGNGDLRIGGEVDLDFLAVTRLHRQNVALQA